MLIFRVVPLLKLKEAIVITATCEQKILC